MQRPIGPPRAPPFGPRRQSFIAQSIAGNVLARVDPVAGQAEPRPPRDQAPNALGNLYRTSDDRWFIVAVVSEERQWASLATAMGLAQLIDDSRFATTAARRANASALMDIFDEVFATATLAEWRARLDAAEEKPAHAALPR